MKNDHPILRLAELEEKKANDCCLAMAEEFLPKSFRNKELLSHRELQRTVLRKYLRTAGLLRALMQHLVEMDHEERKGNGVSVREILNHPKLKKYMKKVIDACKSFEE